MTDEAARDGAGAELVTLLELHDPVRAEMAVDLLRQEGIPVVVTGLHHSSLLGPFGSVIRVVVRVPARERARAEELLDALQEGLGELVDDPATPVELYRRAEPEALERDGRPRAGGPYRPEPRPRRRAPRSPAAATLLAVFPSFGSGHLYAGRARTGVALACAQVASIGLAAAGLEWALLGVPAALVLDAVGAARAVRER